MGNTKSYNFEILLDEKKKLYTNKEHNCLYTIKDDNTVIKKEIDKLNFVFVDSKLGTVYDARSGSCSDEKCLFHIEKFIIHELNYISLIRNDPIHNDYQLVSTCNNYLLFDTCDLNPEHHTYYTLNLNQQYDDHITKLNPISIKTSEFQSYSTPINGFWVFSNHILLFSRKLILIIDLASHNEIAKLILPETATLRIKEEIYNETFLLDINYYNGISCLGRLILKNPRIEILQGKYKVSPTILDNVKDYFKPYFIRDIVNIVFEYFL